MRPWFEGPARRRAERALGDAIERFRRTGYTEVRRHGPVAASVSGGKGVPLRLELVPVGRIFGGTYGLEISSDRPLLPSTGGLTARGRGTVRLTGVAFRAHRGDPAGVALAARLERNGALIAKLTDVHFERVRIEPDGRPVIRHMGGSVVWVLFPPLVRVIPLVPDQARAVSAAFQELAAEGA